MFFGLPSLRLKGLYLAIATLAAQQIVEWIITHWTGLTGGTEALVVPAPRLFGARMNTDFRFYWFAVLAASGTALFAANLFRSRVGRAFVAIRDQDIAAEASGVNLFRYKLTAFAVSSFFVGMSGALIAHYRTIVTWERFTLEVSILYLAMVIVRRARKYRGLVSRRFGHHALARAHRDIRPCASDELPSRCRDLARGAGRCIRARRFARAHPRAPWTRQALVEREDLFPAVAFFLLAWLVPADVLKRGDGAQ